MADKQVNQAQVIWAVVLILAGLGVFYRIPQVMPTIRADPEIRIRLRLYPLLFLLHRHLPHRGRMQKN
jgi:hypothetical protein